MSWSIVGACVWLIVDNVIAMFPSKRKHWPAAYVLIAGLARSRASAGAALDAELAAARMRAEPAE